MKPIEAGCMAIVVGVNKPKNAYLIGKVVKVLFGVEEMVIFKDPLIGGNRYIKLGNGFGWITNLPNDKGLASSFSKNHLMRIDGGEFEEYDECIETESVEEK